MNYTKHYNLLISKAKTQDTSGLYTETHHILPRCLGGTDDSSNLVKLTPEQHYTAHLLLAKMHGGGLWFAAVMMCNGIKNRNNKAYGWVRRKANLAHSTAIKDGWARKYGFNDYLHQCESIWNEFLSCKSKAHSGAKFGINKPNSANCVNYWAELTQQTNLMNKLVYEKKSEISKNTRANINPESEAKRIAATKAADYSNRKRCHK